MARNRAVVTAGFIVAALVLSVVLGQRLAQARPAQATAAQVSVDHVTLEPGETGVVPVRFDGLTSPGLGSYAFTIEFDPTVIVVDAVEGGEPSASPFNAPPIQNIDQESGLVSFTAFNASLTGPTGDFVIAQLRITVTSTPGFFTDLILTVDAMADAEGEDLDPTPAVIDGSVTVGIHGDPPPVVIGPFSATGDTKQEQAAPGDPVQIFIDITTPVGAQSLPPQVAGIQFSLLFDSALVEYQDVALEPGFADCNIEDNQPELGKVNVALACSLGHEYPFRILKFTLLAAENVTGTASTTVSVVNPTLSDFDFKPIEVDQNDAGAAPVIVTVGLICGDVNDDSDVNILDVILILRFIVGLPVATLTDKQLHQANVVDDDVNVIDAVKILRAILEGTEAELTCSAPTEVHPLAIP